MLNHRANDVHWRNVRTDGGVVIVQRNQLKNNISSFVCAARPVLFKRGFFASVFSNYEVTWNRAYVRVDDDQVALCKLRGH